MNRALVDKLARALLYEGYILYPYRPSVKNRQRWTFGGLYPQSYSEAQEGSDPWIMQTQCLFAGGTDAALQVTIRFLHLCDRTIGEFSSPVAEWPARDDLDCRLVEFLEAGGKRYQAWQEATEREVDLGEFNVGELLAQPRKMSFDFPSHEATEAIRSGNGMIVGILIRKQQAIRGDVEISAKTVGDGLIKLTVKILNRTPLAEARNTTRDEALMRSLVSTHTILGLRQGEFVSMTDPPDEWRDQVSACQNIGAWPILVGTGSERDTMLSSPIILYDYPQVAPESPGDLFDSTEIDEILSLRILTLTDEEKRAVSGVDNRARELLARTESLAREQLMNLHGTIRGLRPVIQEQNHV